jgi:hypothetical protein
MSVMTAEEIDKELTAAIPETISLARMVARVITVIADALEAAVLPKPVTAVAPVAPVAPVDQPAAAEAEKTAEPVADAGSQLNAPGVFLGES